MPQAAQEKPKDASVFPFNVNDGDIDFGDGKVSVTLDYVRKSGNTVVAVYYVDDKGGMTKMPNSAFKGGKVLFPVGHFSIYAIEQEATPFTFLPVFIPPSFRFPPSKLNLYIVLSLPVPQIKTPACEGWRFDLRQICDNRRKKPANVVFAGFFRYNNYLLENWGARRAALRPYF